MPVRHRMSRASQWGKFRLGVRRQAARWPIHLRYLRGRREESVWSCGSEHGGGSPGSKYNPLFLYGASGWGKRTCCTPSGTNSPPATRTGGFTVVTCEQFVTHFIRSMLNQRKQPSSVSLMKEFRSCYRETPDGSIGRRHPVPLQPASRRSPILSTSWQAFCWTDLLSRVGGVECGAELQRTGCRRPIERPASRVLTRAKLFHRLTLLGCLRLVQT